MDYGRVLTRALDLTWRFKWLWLLALFAGEASGSPSWGGQGLGNPYGTRSAGGSSSAGPPNFRPLQDWIGAHIGLLVFLAVLVLIVYVVLFIISCGAEAALVRGTEAAELGEEISLGRAITLGLERFAGVLRLRLLLFAASLVVVMAALAAAGLIILSFVLHAYLAAAILIVAAIGAGVILFVIGVAFPTFTRLSLRAVILDRAGAVGGIRAAVGLIRRRLGPVAVLWVIELAIGLVIGIALAVVLIALAVPGVVILYAALSGPGSGVALVAVGALALVLVIALIVFGAAVSAYLSVYWTLGYRQLRSA